MTLLSETAKLSGKDLQRRSLPPATPLLLFAAALALAYGFEVFSFGLTIDEELYGELGNAAYAEKWVEQGRWAMSLLILAVPSPVVPVVSTGLGVGLSAAGWWLLSRRHLGMGPWQSAAVCSLAGTVPVLAFIFSFATIAFGIGVGNLLLVAYMGGLTATSWKSRGLGVIAGAASVGIYDSFLVAMAALSLGFVFARPKLTSLVLGFGAVVGALVISRLLATIASLVFDVSRGSYVAQFMNWEELFSDPIAHLSTALVRTAQVLFLWEGIFGLPSPWLGAVIISLSLLAIYSASQPRPRGGERALRLAAVAGLVLLPFGAAISASMPLRSMLYLPVITLVVASAALEGTRGFNPSLRQAGSAVAAAVFALSIIGNATISNRLFASAQTTYALDQQLAFQIGLEKDKLLTDTQTNSLPLVVAGRHLRPNAKLRPEQETLGASFFGWDNGTERAGAFLRMHGVNVDKPTPEQVQQARPVLDEMPPYPLDGWVQVHDGVLLVKFS